jgi:L-fuconolactonase
MHVVDTHCHASPTWYEPIEALVFQMDANGVDQAVLVQHRGQFDNEYIFECTRRFPGRFAPLVLVDVEREDAPEELERLARQGACGVRLRPYAPASGAGDIAVWEKASELRLPVSCGGKKEDFLGGWFRKVLERFSDLPIILEHLASHNHPDGEPEPFECRRRVFGLAKYPNLYIKFHGLGEFCERNMPVTEPNPFEGRENSILELAYGAFGPERMMWGSDYPPVSGREGYGNALRLPMEQLESKGERALELMFGGVAQKLFKLS